MRYQWLDVAKGIGIILVVFGHVLRGLIKSDIINNDLFLYVDSIIYTFHMPLFMVLSGIFIVSSIEKYRGRRFIISKLDTIFYPYIFWMIFQGTFEVLLSNYTNGNASFIEVFSLWLPRAQFWYLYALFLFMMLFLMVYTIHRNLIVLLLILSISLYVLYGFEEMRVVSFFNRFLVFFIVGSLFGYVLPRLENILSNSYFSITVIVAAIILQYFYHFILEMKYTDYHYLTLMLSFISILAVMAVSYTVSQWSFGVFVSALGEASILIYLGHILTASGIRVVNSKLLGLDSVYLHVTLGLIFGILPWLALYRLSLRFVIIKNLYQTRLFDKLVKI